MPRTKDVAAAIVLKGGCVLLARRAKGQKLEGAWEFPGGKLESGETPQTCIVRELAEELALHAVAGEVLTTNLHLYPGGAINLIAVRVRLLSEDWQLSVHDRVEWVSADQLMLIDLAPADIPVAEYVCGLLKGADGE